METNTSRSDELLTPEQVAARLGVSREVVLQLVARDQLVAYRVGRSLRFAPADVSA
jgi:excisionase family DNA binding protein